MSVGEPREVEEDQELSNTPAVSTQDVSSSDLNRSDSDDDDDDTEYNSNVTDNMAYYDRAVEEIRQGDIYTCMICTVEMDYRCQMYACNHCYRVFDYDCIREWALKSTERTVDKTWKCPNCSHVNKKVPAANRATCWCGKVINPDPNELNPNSCGQTCDANICVHGCSKMCHLGPHPECIRSVHIRCRCGRHTREITCSQAKQFKGKRKYQCEEECGLLLACGIHRCKKVCHTGICGACPEILLADESQDVAIKCYCGTNQLDKIYCKDVKIVNQCKSTKVKDSEDAVDPSPIGVYACDEIRTVEYSCHQHSFVEKCIVLLTKSGTKPCPFSPKLLKTCPCGKTPLVSLAKPRTKCTDPIPHCDSQCDKSLKCGKHRCPFTCHDGPCMDPCTQIEKVKCCCEQSTFLVPCGLHEKPHCNLKCESLMSCRRHRCLDRCCSGRPAAEVRKKTHFRTADLADETLVEPEHVCLQDCNLLLSCGKHICQRKCHPGKCPPCLESDSNDLVCPCGKTIVEAPVRCGTKLPPCPYPCIKVVRGESVCGHVPIEHPCHSLDTPCPPCTASVFKPCKCGKVEKVRTVCFQKDVSCGKICNKPLTTCEHLCQKKCHLPGECQTKCKQVCHRKRVGCDHFCVRPCHSFTECPDTPCTALIKIHCACGRRAQEVVCGATATEPSKALEKGDSQLPCDQECELVKRHEQLKLAFGISDKSTSVNGIELDKLHSLANVAQSFEELQLPYGESTVSTYARQPEWCEQIVIVLNKLLDDKTRGSLHFKPMRASARHFVVELAKSYGLYAESQDPEPKRSVFVKKELGSVKPTLSLAEIVPLYQSFKQADKERKAKEYESRSTTTLLNVIADPASLNSSSSSFEAEYTGFKLQDVADGVTEEELSAMIGPYFEGTLINDPQFRIYEDNDEAHTRYALLYPAAYASVSENCAGDIQQLLPHVEYLCRDNLVAGSVALCNISQIYHSDVPDIATTVTASQATEETDNSSKEESLSPDII